MKSKMQFLKIIGCISLFTFGTLTLLNTRFFGLDIFENLLEVSDTIKDHCNTSYNCNGMHPPGCCSICSTKGK